jgi:hypothetical protein
MRKKKKKKINYYSRLSVEFFIVAVGDFQSSGKMRCSSELLCIGRKVYFG